MPWSGYFTDDVEQNPIGVQGYLYLKNRNIGFIECDHEYYDEPLVPNNPPPPAPPAPIQPMNPPRRG